MSVTMTVIAIMHLFFLVVINFFSFFIVITSLLRQVMSPSHVC